MSNIMEMPKIGVNMTEAMIGSWYVKPGDTISEGDAIAEIEADKAAQILYADKAGTIAELCAKEGDVVACHAPLLTFAGDGGERPVEQTTVAVASRRLRISPLAKKTASALAIDHKELVFDYKELSDVVGDRRIVKADILAYAQNKLKNPETGGDAFSYLKSANAATGTDVAQYTPTNPEKANTLASPEAASFIPLTGARRIIADRLTESHLTKPSVPLVAEIDMTETIEWRNKLKAKGLTVSYNDIAIKVVASISRGFPFLHAKYVNNAIMESTRVNIGMAVDTPKGLLAPVIKDADKKGLIKISEESREMIGRARNGQSTAEDLSGGTFTITNLGTYDIIFFVPIINLDESNILALGQIVKRPVVVGDDVIIKPIIYATLVFDHRVVDGAPAAKSLQRFKYLMENPLELLN